MLAQAGDGRQACLSTAACTQGWTVQCPPCKLTHMAMLLCGCMLASDLPRVSAPIYFAKSKLIHIHPCATTAVSENDGPHVVPAGRPCYSLGSYQSASQRGLFAQSLECQCQRPLPILCLNPALPRAIRMAAMHSWQTLQTPQGRLCLPGAPVAVLHRRHRLARPQTKLQASRMTTSCSP